MGDVTKKKQLMTELVRLHDYPTNRIKAQQQQSSWPAHRGACLGPGRASWHVLLAAQVVRARGCLSPCRGLQDHGKATVSAFGAAAASCLYHTAPQDLELYIFRQPRRNNPRSMPLTHAAGACRHMQIGAPQAFFYFDIATKMGKCL